VEIVLAGKLRRGFVELGAPWRSLATLLHLRGHTGALRGDRCPGAHRRACRRAPHEECCDPRLAISVTKPRREYLGSRHGRFRLAEFILASGALARHVRRARSIGGGLYWDGGIANPLPFRPLAGRPGDRYDSRHVVANQEELAACDAGASIGISPGR